MIQHHLLQTPPPSTPPNPCYLHTPFTKISPIRCNFSASASQNRTNAAELSNPVGQNDNFSSSLTSSSLNSSPSVMGPFTGRDLSVKKPEWLRQKAPQGQKYEEVKETLSRLNLNTVCQEAQCPNIGEVYVNLVFISYIGGFGFRVVIALLNVCLVLKLTEI